MASKSNKSVGETIAHDPGSASCACPSCVGAGETETLSRLDDLNDGSWYQSSGNIISAAPWLLEVNDTDGIFNNKQIFDLSQVIGQLDSGARLHAPNGIVTYTFLTTPHAIGYYNNPNFSVRDADGYSPFSAEQQAAAREAIQLWDDLIPLSFRESTGAGADVVFANTTTGPAQAHAFYPGVGLRVVSDVWTATPEVNSSNQWLDYNGYGWTTVVHELGHAIGLSHPGSYNFSANFSVTYTNGAEYAQDTRQYSTMSYWNTFDPDFGPTNPGNPFVARPVDLAVGLLTYPQTPMIHDIYVIQQMYGADTTTRADSTVYGFNSTADHDVYNFEINRAPYLAIYDAGGEADWIDMSGADAGVFIDLRAGSFSSGAVRPTLEEANADVAAFNADDPFDGAYVAATWTQATLDSQVAGQGQLNARLIATTTGVSNIQALSYQNISIAYNTTIENVAGSNQRDYLVGNDGANILLGNAGDDVLAGLLGDDTLDGGAGLDVVSYTGASAGVTVNLASGNTHTTIEGTDTFIGIEGLFGSDFNDTLSGDAGDNLLGGGKGNDALHGGAGLDILSYMGATQNLTLALDESGNGAFTNAQTGMGDDSFTGMEGLAGGSGNDILTGNSQNNVLDGDDGNDVLHGLGGDDRLIGGFGNDTLNGGIGNDTLLGGIGLDTLSGDAGNDILEGGFSNDTLTGGEGDDTLKGDQGNDVLLGGAGNDSLDGGEGSDTADFRFATNAIIASLVLGAGTANGEGVDTMSGIENLTGSEQGDTLSGDVNANVLTGLGGNDVLTGGEGDDTLAGGAGDDTLNGGDGIDTASFGAATVVNLSTGTATGEGADTLTGIENVNGSAGADQITGSAVNNVLNGGDGIDVINGGDGNDTINGGAGNDTINGEGGDDTLLGGAGNDTISGGGGNDTASFAGSLAGVTVNLLAGTASGEGSDTLSGIENITGSAAGDNLIGDDNVNVIVGGAGNDILDGRGGNDRLDGGAGSDLVSYAVAASGVTVSLADTNPHAVTGYGSDTFVSIEGVIGSDHDDTLTGDGLTNFLFGGGGNDIIAGGAGSDQLDGGAGNDTLTGGDGNDSLSGGAGNDTLNGGTGSDSATFAAAASGVTVNLVTGTATGGDGNDTLVGIESVTGSAHNDTLTGDALANSLSGGAGNDVINAGLGNDTLAGGLGDDTLNGGDGTDTVNYLNSLTAVTVNLGAGTAIGEGSDSLLGIENVGGSNGNDTITGNAGANILVGNGGADTLNGGGGADTLTGGAGNDIFQIINLDGVDRIMDFAPGDKIDLSQIDANAILDGDQGFSFIGGADFSGGGAAGQLRYEGGFVQGDLNGDALADFSINIANFFALQGGDFVL